jgi:hypothetical protein
MSEDFFEKREGKERGKREKKKREGKEKNRKRRKIFKISHDSQHSSTRHIVIEQND